MNPMRTFQTTDARNLFSLAVTAMVMITGLLAEAQSNSAPPVNYSTFSKFITERNIFNPNRYARAANTRYVPRTRSIRRNSFGLAGMMSYDEGENAGIHAFFDGTSADFRKVLQPGGTIAVFKITEITPESVTLLLDTNVTVLKVGQQMRDDGQGHWSLSPETVNYALTATGNSSRNGRRGDNGSRDEAGGEQSSENTDTNLVEGVPMPGDFAGDQGEPAGDAVETPTENTPAEAVPLPSGPGSDALRRLMELRAQEEQSGNRN